jgi:hypothetical protein
MSLSQPQNSRKEPTTGGRSGDESLMKGIGSLAVDTGHDLLVMAAAEDWVSLWMLDRTTTDAKIRTATEEFNPAGTGVNKSGS